MNEQNNIGAKIIGGLVAAVAVWGIWQVLKMTDAPKKNLDGLGDLNTAKTKAGKIKQRAAVFAKLDEEGKTYKKNRNGKRSKRVKK